MSGHTAQVLCASLVMLVLLALAIAATLEPDDDHKKKKALEEAEKRKAERAAKVAKQTEELKARGKHITTRLWTPSVSHLAPEKPEPKAAANVRPIRKQR
jgi:Flp pilus assembly protein TadB